MIRRLVLMRHAKSDWNSNAQTDHDRPLNPRGRRDAPRMAQHLVANGIVPDRVILSDSVRTRETWDGMWSLFPELTPEFLNSLYHGGLREISDAVSRFGRGSDTLLVLGHNPGWSMAASWLCGQHVLLKTADIAVLEQSVWEWEDSFKAGVWSLTAHWNPKRI